MKKIALPVLLLGLFSSLSGYLLSKASFIGRVGISFFYKEYSFLKTWWKGALVAFSILLILFILQGWTEKKLIKWKASLLHIILIAVASAGLYFTYYDFRHTLSHRLLGERFHIGAYLFWIEWMLISLFYLAQKKTGKEAALVKMNQLNN